MNLSAGRHRQLASAWLLHGSVEATLLTVPDYDLSNHLELGPRLGLQRNFGLGPLAPVLQLDTALTYKSARLDADREALYLVQHALLARVVTHRFPLDDIAQAFETIRSGAGLKMVILP